MTNLKNQQVLIDKTKTGKSRFWSERKTHNLILSEAYKFVDIRKSERLSDCAGWLVFKKFDNGDKKLDKADFCRIRLCPICSWRRSLKIFGQMHKIMSAMKTEGQYSFIFLTLTVANCKKDQLNSQLDAMMSGWKNLIKYKAIKTVVKGWYRGLEVTHNTDIGSKSYDTYHPHFHAVFAVPTWYFTHKSYLSKDEWADYWKKAMGLEYEPVVDVRKVKGDTVGAVLEATRYTVKTEDYIIADDWDLSVDAVRVLDKALHKRRLVAFGGIMKDLHKSLNLDDAIDGDLLHIQDENLSEDNYRLVRYVFSIGYNQYITNDDQEGL